MSWNLRVRGAPDSVRMAIDACDDCPGEIKQMIANRISEVAKGGHIVVETRGHLNGDGGHAYVDIRRL